MRAAAGLGAEQFVEHRVIDHAQQRRPAAPEPQRDAEVRETMGVVIGAVERVDQPREVGLADRSALLGQNRDGRETRP